MNDMKGPVLIVDDYKELLFSIKDSLESEGYACLIFTNVSKAIDSIREGLEYKIAFVDIQASGRLSGDDLVYLSKNLHPEIPVYTLSGYLHKLIGSDGLIKKGNGMNDKILRVLEDRLK
jgi:DNA-binding NtrC family response regulator